MGLVLLMPWVGGSMLTQEQLWEFALLAAAAAVIVTVDIPELKQKIQAQRSLCPKDCANLEILRNVGLKENRSRSRASIRASWLELSS